MAMTNSPPAISAGLRAVAVVSAALFVGCGERSTARLAPDTESRLSAEGIVHRADDLVFRYTYGAGRSNAGWEDRRASIVVTGKSVLIHKNAKVGLDIRPGHADRYGVERSGNRVRVRSGAGRSAEIWSFEPPGDAAGWTADIRSVIRAATTSTH
jgi:hypothetical protein